MSNSNNLNNVVEEHEALMFHVYPPCAYYVQSPSATTLTHNDTESSSFHSPLRSDTHHPSNPTHDDPATCFALCRYSSSRGSTHSFHQKKISYDGSHAGTAPTENGDVNRLIIVDGDDDDDDWFDYDWKRKGGWKRYCTYQNSDSCAWIWLQISWRIFLSLGVALLVFYIATKPPPPQLSLQIARIREFKLGEGVDRTGVSTKILNCNCSMNLLIVNKSKFFGLHIRPPITHMSFGILPFALSHGRELYAESGSTIFKLEVGTKNKAMYGAGRSMEDMLDSGRGLPIVIRVRVSSSFRVVPNLINPKFHHQLQCRVLLNKAYDKKHRTQAFKSTCQVTS